MTLDKRFDNVPMEQTVEVLQLRRDLRELPPAQSEQKKESVGCNGCRYDWFGDPRCAKCARLFQDYYKAERRGKKE